MGCFQPYFRAHFVFLKWDYTGPWNPRFWEPGVGQSPLIHAFRALYSVLAGTFYLSIAHSPVLQLLQMNCICLEEELTSML